MTGDPRLTPLAAALPDTVPFVGPETIERMSGRSFAARIGANESGFGPSPRAIEAMQAALGDVWKYPDPASHDLRTALADRHGVPMECLVVGAGVDGLLGSAVRLFAGPGDRVVASAGSYPTFAYHVTGHGASSVAVPYDGLHEDPEALVMAARDSRAKLVYIANPDNPMGSWHSADTISAMLDAMPDHALLILDEAYEECTDIATAPPVDPGDRRVLRFRTFSKAYGLAGLRVGYAIGHPDLIAAFSLVRNHFGVSRLGQAAAIAALGDRDHLGIVRAGIARSAAEIARIGRDNGLSPRETAANFVALDTGSARRSAALVEALAAQGVFIRRPGVAPLDTHVRISCGPPADMDVLRDAMPAAMSAL